MAVRWSLLLEVDVPGPGQLRAAFEAGAAAGPRGWQTREVGRVRCEQQGCVHNAPFFVRIFKNLLSSNTCFSFFVYFFSFGGLLASSRIFLMSLCSRPTRLNSVAEVDKSCN